MAVSSAAEKNNDKITGDRQKALDSALGQIERAFGKGSIMHLEGDNKIDIETIPTGSVSLDIALGGGIPKGRIVEIEKDNTINLRPAYPILLYPTLPYPFLSYPILSYFILPVRSKLPCRPWRHPWTGLCRGACLRWTLCQPR